MAFEPRVSSFARSFKKATGLSTDVEEVKTAHRTVVKTLIDDYLDKLTKKQVDGIRNAKELSELIKLDLLLLGEATERTDSTNGVDEVRVRRLASMLDEDNDEVQSMIQSIFNTLNDTNDEVDKIESGEIEVEVEEEETENKE